MNETRKLIKVFLASPGDLQEERSEVKNVVQDFNDVWAQTTGYQIELLGWEDTSPGYGRPQEIINAELDRCELVIGIIWKRWGTPSDTNGKYTSGFIEEFERSVERKGKTGSPEISLFFKEIDSEFLHDAGPDLQKVLDFKDGIIQNKNALFQEFKDTKGLSKLVHKRIASYVQNKNPKTLSDNSEKLKEHEQTEASQTQTSGKNSPLSENGLDFLKSLTSRLHDSESIELLDPHEIARFRLLANCIKLSGNDDQYLGNHDTNLLYANKEQICFGEREFGTLTRVGYKNISSETTPFWYWFSSKPSRSAASTAIASIVGSDSEIKAGALKVLDWLDDKLSGTDWPNRQHLLEEWFEDESPAAIKNNALAYLAHQGNSDEIEYIEHEYDRNDSNTAKSALESLLLALWRLFGDDSAAEKAISVQFKYLDDQILPRILTGFQKLNTDTLIPAMDHSCDEIRMCAFRQLDIRNTLNDDLVNKALNDGNPELRYLALLAAIKLGTSFSDAEAKSVLVRKNDTAFSSGIWGALSGINASGEAFYRRYIWDKISKLDEKQLNKNISTSYLVYQDHYFARADKYFRTYSKDLRTNFDDDFKSYFTDKLERLESLPSDQDFLKTLRSTEDLEKSYRNSLIRSARDILCRRGEAEDLSRIRESIANNSIPISWIDLEYLEKHGTSVDIVTIGAKNANYAPTVEPSFPPEKEISITTQKAKVILKICRNSISEAITTISDQAVLLELIKISSNKTFQTISDDALIPLLQSDNSHLRKACALKIVICHTKKRVGNLMQLYISQPTYFYNVVHWLDLAVSIPQQTARSIAKKNLN